MSDYRNPLGDEIDTRHVLARMLADQQAEERWPIRALRGLASYLPTDDRESNQRGPDEDWVTWLARTGQDSGGATFASGAAKAALTTTANWLARKPEIGSDTLAPFGLAAMGVPFTRAMPHQAPRLPKEWAPEFVGPHRADDPWSRNPGAAPRETSQLDDAFARAEATSAQRAISGSMANALDGPNPFLTPRNYEGYSLSRNLDESGDGNFRYSIFRDGERIGDMEGTAKGPTLRIADIMVEGGPGGLGVPGLRALREHVRADFPEVNTFQSFPGERNAGVRSEWGGPTKAGKDQVVKFKADQEAGSLPGLLASAGEQGRGVKITKDGPRWKAESPHGSVSAFLDGNEVIVGGSGLFKGAPKGEGHGLALYQALADEALKHGHVFRSNNGVSTEAARVYEALQRRGYAVERNPNTTTIGDKNIADGGVYRVNRLAADPESSQLAGLLANAGERPVRPDDFMRDIQGRAIPAGDGLSLQWNPNQQWLDIQRGGESVGRTFVAPGNAATGMVDNPNSFVLGPKVNPEHQRQGIASAVYDALASAGEPHGMRLVPGTIISPEAFALWQKRDPAMLAAALRRENAVLKPEQREWLDRQPPGDPLRSILGPAVMLPALANILAGDQEQ